MPIQSLTLDTTVMELARSNDDLLPTTGAITVNAAVGTPFTATTVGGQVGTLPTGTLVGAEMRVVSATTGALQTARITAHTVAGGIATLTHPALTAVSSDGTVFLCNLRGRGISYQGYVQAINAAVDAAMGRTWTDASNVSLAIEKGQGGVTPSGMRRYEYPLPSTLLYLFGVDLLRSRPRASNGIGHYNTRRTFGDVTGRTRIAQGFQIPQQAFISYIAVYMGKVGAPVDNLTCVVEGDSAIAPLLTPDGTPATNGTSQTVNGATLQTRGRFVVFTFSPPLILLEDTAYHFYVKRASDTADASNYYWVGEDDGDNEDEGALSTRDASAWSAVSGSDLLFAISAQDDWAELAAHNWAYRPGSTDSLLIRGDWPEGTIVQLRGGTAIARPATGATEVPLESDYVIAYAQEYLKGNRSGTVTAEPAAQGASAAAQRGRLIQVPYRPWPANCVKVGN